MALTSTQQLYVKTRWVHLRCSNGPFPASSPGTFGRESTTQQSPVHVSLMIKTFPPLRLTAEWEWLQARASEDSRIILIAESLPRDELLSLYGCCDVFLSLHRSEGFGRGMAEALQLGLDVIATDFGGNTDFCTGPLAHPVRWRKVPIPVDYHSQMVIFANPISTMQHNYVSKWPNIDKPPLTSLMLLLPAVTLRFLLNTENGFAFQMWALVIERV